MRSRKIPALLLLLMLGAPVGSAYAFGPMMLLMMPMMMGGQHSGSGGHGADEAKRKPELSAPQVEHAPAPAMETRDRPTPPQSDAASESAAADSVPRPTDR